MEYLFNMKGLETSAIMTSLSSKADGSLGLRIATPELSSEEKVLFMSLQGLNLKMTLEPLEEQAEKIAKVEKGMGGKSESEMLYNTIYVYFKYVKSTEDWPIFYKRHMAAIRDTYKAKLPNIR